MRFLVVEDQGFQLWVMRSLLEGLGAKYIFAAADGKAALELLSGREPPIDIIVSDIDMPGMDGMEFIRHVAGAGYRASLIVASGLPSQLLSGVETMADAYGMRVLGALSKPVSAVKLRALVNLHATPPVKDSRPNPMHWSTGEIAEGLQGGEFEPFFQAKVDMATSEVKGAEALARWRHRQDGIVRPLSFVPSMEETGLIDALTLHILDRACVACRDWSTAGAGGTVSVNLSVASLGDIAFGDKLWSMVRAHGLDAEQVILEVTESVSGHGHARALENLSRLRMKGFGLSIDDFGTGHSSMERLAGIAFSELKIDQSFVRRASTHSASRTMLESSLDMARKLGITAVAEGIESRAEWDLVRSLGCDLAQGYLVAEPMEAARYRDWLLARERKTA